MALTTNWNPAGGIEPWGNDLALPRRWTSIITDDGSVPFDLTLDVEVRHGQPACTRLEVTGREGGEAITWEGLRALPIARILGNLAAYAALRAHRTEDGGVRYEPAGADDIEVIMEAVRGVGRKRRTIDDDFLRSVAEVYEAAAENPTKAVAETFATSRQNARKWLAMAEDRGLVRRASR